VNSGRGYKEVNIGDCFDHSMTLTETHIVLGAAWRLLGHLLDCRQEIFQAKA